ncbi:MAG: hypothetical protein AAGB22_15985, partial [Bacteroidota bacterium]
MPNVALSVDYDPASGSSYQDISLHPFSGGHRVVVVVKSITGPVTKDLRLITETDAERYYNFNPQFTPSPSAGFTTTLNNATELQVNWNFIPGAEEYDFEWTWVNDYDGAGGTLPLNQLDYNFGINATRVRVSKEEYVIPLVYEQGQLLYRVRGVGRGGTDFSIPIEGRWSTHVVGHQGTVDILPSNSRYTIAGGSAHMNEALNWGAATAFIENGVRSTAVDYQDGTGRSRQSVAKLNTEDKTMAGSVLYDHQGRPAVQVLPSPLPTKELKYTEQLNVSSAVGSPIFGKQDFDLDKASDPCQVELSPMDPALSKGAANYYSPNNPDMEGA